MTYTANQMQELVQQEMMNFISQFENQLSTTDDSSLLPSPPPETPPQTIINTPPPVEQGSINSALTAASIQQLITDAINQTIPAPNSHRNNQRNNRNRNNNNRNGSNNNARNNAQKCQAIVDGFPVTYCWSHGVTQNLSHTSATCQRKHDGHKSEATYDNRMGGSDAILSTNNRR
jgi:hypothetical protein